MAKSSSFDKTFQRRKKAVVIVATLLVIMLGGLLIGGQVGGPSETERPSPTAFAAITTPPPTATKVTAPSTETALPTVTATSAPTNTIPPLPTTSQPPSPTPALPTPTPTPSPTPSPTPEPPTPTPPPVTPSPPTPTPTTTSAARRPLVIVSPTDGSQLPSDALTMAGSAEPGTTVVVHEGNTPLGEATADKDGNWSLVPAEQLAAGEHTIVVLDVVTGETSAPVTFTLLQAWLPITGNEHPHCP